MSNNIVLDYDPKKNRLNIELRDLDFELAAFVLTDPKVFTKRDVRKDYGEDRYLSFGKAGDLRLCVCWTPRDGKIRVITVFQVHKKEWEKNYGKDD